MRAFCIVQDFFLVVNDDNREFKESELCPIVTMIPAEANHIPHLRSIAKQGAFIAQRTNYEFLQSLIKTFGDDEMAWHTYLYLRQDGVFDTLGGEEMIKGELIQRWGAKKGYLYTHDHLPPLSYIQAQYKQNPEWYRQGERPVYVTWPRPRHEPESTCPCRLLADETKTILN